MIKKECFLHKKNPHFLGLAFFIAGMRQDILGISRTSAYNLVKKAPFHIVRIGGTIRISKKSFDEWVDQQL